MTHLRRRLGRRAVFALLAGTGTAGAQPAAPWPSRPIRLVVPFAPGGPTDVMARVLAPGLSAALGQPVVVDNRPGGGGNVGVAHVARSAPDGTTLLVTSTGFVVNPSLFRNPGYDPVQDFAPITELGASPNVILARPDSGIGSIAELVERAKATPGGLNLANPGTGLHAAPDRRAAAAARRHPVRADPAQQRGAGGAVAAVRHHRGRRHRAAAGACADQGRARCAPWR